MAVRFDASADAYLITTGLPTSNVFTFTAWLRIAVDRNDYCEVISFGSTYMSVATNIDGTSVGMWDSGSYNGSPLGSTAFTVGTWYRVAGVVNGANVTFYRSAAGAALASTSAANYTSGTPTSLRLGDYWDSGGFNWDGNMGPFKLWNAALTAAEVEQELTRYTPYRTANLLRFHPFINPEATDYSGNGYTMTAGTATREDGPPIPWQMATPRLVRPAPAGGGSVSGTADAPLGALSATASGVPIVAGTASAPLGLLTASLSGTATAAGTATAPFGTLTSTAAGAQIEPGTASAPLGTLTAGAAGGTSAAGTATAVFGALTAAGFGAVTVAASGVAVLGALAAAAAGLRTVPGSASAPLGSLTAAASGVVSVSAAAVAVLGSLAATAAGTVTGAGGGTAASLLGPLAASTAGTTTAVGTASAALGVLTATAVGVPTVAGIASAALGGLVAQATAQSADASALAPMGGLTASAAGIRMVGASAAAVLGGLLAAANGVTFATGTAVALLGALTASGVVTPPVVFGAMTATARDTARLNPTDRPAARMAATARSSTTMGG